MKDLNELRNAISSYLQKVDGSKFSKEKPFEKNLLAYLEEKEFEVKNQLETQPINEAQLKMFHAAGTKVPDIVIKVKEGFVPLELKFNNSPENYKADERKLNTYYETFTDVPVAWALFLSNIDHKDYHKGDWKDTPSNDEFHYLWRMQSALASKRKATLKLADVWSENKSNEYEK